MRLRPLAFALLLAPAVPRAGDVVGTVRYGGAVPAPAPLEVTKDRPTCGDAQPDESLLVDRGALANAVVSLPAIAGVRLAPATRVLTQERCRFAPRVQVAATGSTLEVVSGDPILHSAHGWLGKRTAFSVQTDDRGERVPARLDRPGVVRVGCDVHAWMAAWVVVGDGPAAVTGRDGGFRIPGIPAGSYTATIWHERLGTRTATVTVPATGDARLDVSLER